MENPENANLIGMMGLIALESSGNRVPLSAQSKGLKRPGRGVDECGNLEKLKRLQMEKKALEEANRQDRRWLEDAKNLNEWLKNVRGREGNEHGLKPEMKMSQSDIQQRNRRLNQIEQEMKQLG